MGPAVFSRAQADGVGSGRRRTIGRGPAGGGSAGEGEEGGPVGAGYWRHLDAFGRGANLVDEARPPEHLLLAWRGTCASRGRRGRRRRRAAWRPPSSGPSGRCRRLGPDRGAPRSTASRSRSALIWRPEERGDLLLARLRARPRRRRPDRRGGWRPRTGAAARASGRARCLGRRTGSCTPTRRRLRRRPSRSARRRPRSAGSGRARRPSRARRVIGWPCNQWAWSGQACDDAREPLGVAEALAAPCRRTSRRSSPTRCRCRRAA